MSDWYYIQKGMIRDETIGPIDTDTLAKRIRRGEITPDTIISSPDKTHNALVKMSAFPKLVEIYVQGEQERTRESEKQKEAKIEQRRQEKELAAKQKELARQERMREKMEKMEEQQARIAVARPQSQTQPIAQFQAQSPPQFLPQPFPEQAPTRKGGSETVLYRANPAMFRNSPVRFVLLCFLCLFIIGIPLMLIWWLRCKSTELTITDTKVILRKGILRKDLNEVRHAHIRNVLMQQSFFQRILGTGWLGVSTSGQAGIEVGVNGIPSPARAKAIIDQFIQ